MPAARSLAVTFLRTVAMTAALACAACAAGAPTIPRVRDILGQPNLTSFLDVRFGDSLYRVQNRFPSGTVETAPYGADTYRIDDIEVDSIRYPRVKFEFTTYTGMQLVMAWFTPDSSEKVLKNLIQTVGAPSEQKSTGTVAAETEAVWRLPHSERVVYNGPKRFVAVVGPGGGPLRQDAIENEQLDTPQ